MQIIRRWIVGITLATSCGLFLIFQNCLSTPVISPTGPSEDLNPVVSGTAAAGAQVDIFFDPACENSVASTQADLNGAYSVSVTVSPNDSTSIYAMEEFEAQCIFVGDYVHECEGCEFCGNGICDIFEVGGSAGVIKIDPQGRAIVASSIDTHYGYSTWYEALRVQRFFANGERDESFGGDGEVIQHMVSSYRGGSDDFPILVEFGPDGKIYIQVQSYIGGDQYISHAWLTEDGSWDSDFYGTGRAFDYPDGLRLFDSAPVGDGRVLSLAADPFGGEGDPKLSLVRYLPDQSRDPSFGVDGRLDTTVPYPNYNVTARQVVLDAEGRILVLAADLHDQSISRFHENGEVDLSFGSLGRVQLPTFRHSTYALATLSDSSVVVAGFRHSESCVRNKMFLYYLDPSGLPRSEYGEDGYVYDDVSVDEWPGGERTSLWPYHLTVGASDQVYVGGNARRITFSPDSFIRSYENGELTGELQINRDQTSAHYPFTLELALGDLHFGLMNVGFSGNWVRTASSLPPKSKPAAALENCN